MKGELDRVLYFLWLFDLVLIGTFEPFKWWIDEMAIGFPMMF
ncbi:hypothetical protein KR52_07220 [Synechococcus sp. KORDI-52]|nr:hypothetical protein [Synechococcus sp. KORDI-52]AII48930.1 hypothetical protein KR52_07220 [Synechococcus sp. KORDI-52]